MPLSSRPSAWFRLSGALVWFVPFVALVACRRSAPPEEGPARCVLPPHEPAPPASRTAPADVNVLGGPLAICGTSPLTGVYRDGRCATGADDVGVHVVCAAVTEPFLRFTAARGNDLVTPRGGFPGLRPGDRWCLCASRWAEAEANGVAPPVVAEATHARAAELLGRERLLAPAR